ncbi:uncharacterized protein LOC119675157 [Teleopsis dalmanni]|uniref:uncharacterized protein LOC119675157 n=1 Tax=Teleopsis dalmanni TaxID=139649 RepID=UPI000D32D0A9|nr:uncharacterized protein LOC119675157 [Teleopsis dalmanni]
MAENSQVKTNKRSRNAWTDSGENLLIELWEENISQLRSRRRNSHIFKDMATELCKMGYTVTAVEVQRKVHNFTQRFRKEQQSVGVSEGSLSTWRFSEGISKILGNLPLHNITGLIPNSFGDQEPAPSTSSCASSPILPASSPWCSSSDISEGNTQETPKRKKKKDDERLDKLINLQEKLVDSFNTANKNITDIVKALETGNSILARMAASMEKRYPYESVVSDEDSND